MATKAVVNNATLDAIATAINTKAGTTGTMKPSEMAAKIAAIPTGDSGYAHCEESDYLVRGLPDITQIIHDDVAPTGYRKLFIGLCNNTSDVATLFSRINYYLKFSDGQVYTPSSTTVDHRWDSTKDITVESVAAKKMLQSEKARWFIVYCSSSVDGSVEINRDFLGKFNGQLVWLHSVSQTHVSGITGSQDSLAYVTQSEDSVFSVRGAGANGPFFTNCHAMQVIPLRTSVNVTTKVTYTSSGGFNGANSLIIAPAEINYTAGGNAAGHFGSCASLTSVPSVIDFSLCNSLGSYFSGCWRLKYVPDVMDLSSATNVSSMFNQCAQLKRVPTHLTSPLSLSFSSSGLIERDSVAVFENGAIVGGMVFNMNTCPNNGQTITFHANVKAAFSADEWTAIKTAMAAKNWGVSPA